MVILMVVGRERPADWVVGVVGRERRLDVDDCGDWDGDRLGLSLVRLDSTEETRVRSTVGKMSAG